MLNVIDHVNNVSRNGTENNGFCKQLHIPSETSRTHQIQEEVETALRAHHYEERDIFCIRLALEEALVNAIKHGNQLNRNKQVAIAYSVTPERFEIRIEDEGKGFDPADVPDPKAPENLERPCGRGLLLMRHYMSDVVVHAPGNAITMIKVRNQNETKE